MAGVEARRGCARPAGLAGGRSQPPTQPTFNRAAQDRTVAAGGKLTPEEEAKRKKHPLDRFDEISATAAAGKFPKGLDVFLTKFHGLFYVAPAQDAFMCRLRIPGGILTCASDARHRVDRRRPGRRLRRHHHARQSAASRNPRDERAGDAAAAVRDRPDLARRRRRQHPQHHRQPHRRHRSAGADRYAAVLPRACITSSSTIANCTACRASSTSPSTAAAAWRCWRTPTTSRSSAVQVADGFGVTPACISGSAWAASPGTAISPATPA